jgi:hypothetical protein
MDEAVKDKFDINNQEHKAIMNEVKDLNRNLTLFQIEMTKSIAELPVRLQEEFDNRYASKETERIVKKVQWLIISAVLTTLLGIVFIDKFADKIVK